VKFDSLSLELPFSLDEIPGVGPEADMVFSDNEVTFSGVAGDPGNLMPSWCRIFAVVGIYASQNDGIPTP
jgi:hypothetical protein